MPRLTAKQVQALKQPGRHGDGDGLYLEISRTGSKSWILRVTVNGRRRDIGLGGLSWVTLAQAREKARELRAAAKDGRDPVAERKAKQAAPTLEAAARELHGKLKPGWRKDGVHVKHWISSLERFVFPRLGDRPVNTITSGDVLEVLTPIWHEKAETARRVRQRLRQVFQWAKGQNWYPAENPVDVASGSLPRANKAARRHYAAMPYEQIPGFMAELREREGIAALALAFAVLTAARSGEVRGARWSEIDLENALWTIPGPRMKAGRPHRVPLTGDALALLEKVRGLDKGLVFPGLKRGKPMSDMTLSAVVKRMEREGVTVHGFRSSFRDWAAERTTFPREIAELALAHEVGNAVERAYRRSDLFAKRRQLMEAWARYCASGEGKGNVVALRNG